jgi:hypothetical protein
MTRDDVDLFEKLTGQLEATHREISALAKKSAKDAVNAFKLKLINATLSQCNNLLGVEYRPFPDFSTFDVDDLPSNSDVSFIIAQYLQCAEKFRADHIVSMYGDWHWVIEDGKGPLTSSPRKLINKG